MGEITHGIFIWGKAPTPGRFAPGVEQSAQIGYLHLINHNFFYYVY